MQIFSSFTLKLMAIIFMAMDHIATYWYTDIPVWFHYFGRLVAPIFFYLVVEGFFHTRDRVNYIKRMFIMGLVMIGIDIVLGIHNNIFLSLGFGISLMYFIEKVKECKLNHIKCTKFIVASILCSVAMLFTEASIFGLAQILIFYFLREKKGLMSIAYIILSLLVLTASIGPNFYKQAFIYDPQWMMVFAIIPISMYNGKLGLSNKVIKWLFYWFYPIHLIVIVTVGNMFFPMQQLEENTVNNEIMQEVVTKIDSKIDFKSDKELIYTLENKNGNFKGIYTVMLYNKETKIEIGYDIKDVSRKNNLVNGTIKIEDESQNLVKGNEYILSVVDGDSGEILFENITILN